MQFRKITIVGVGLLGGSIALAVRRRGLTDQIAGYVRSEKSLADCEKFGSVDYATTDLLAAVSNADLVILCTPLAQMPPLTRQLLPALKPGAVVTDVGSVKADVVRELELLVKPTGAAFIGSHPMAGAEKTGVAAARASLFEKAVCVITPTRKSPASMVRKLAKFWKSLGAHVLILDSARHDLLVSRASHLPHVLAAALSGMVLDPKKPKQQVELCATGFRDTTRIASGSPEMWRDIALANRKNISRSLDDFVAELKKFRAAIRASDGEAVEEFFATAKTRRDQWCANANSTSLE